MPWNGNPLKWIKLHRSSCTNKVICWKRATISAVFAENIVVLHKKIDSGHLSYVVYRSSRLYLFQVSANQYFRIDVKWNSKQLKCYDLFIVYSAFCDESFPGGQAEVVRGSSVHLSNKSLCISPVFRKHAFSMFRLCFIKCQLFNFQVL